MLKFAFYCGRKGGIYPTFYNCVNEILVNLFLKEKIKFTHIEILMEKSLEKFEKENYLDKSMLTMENISFTEKEAERIVLEIL